MSNTFKAMLTQAISYTGFDGKPRTLAKGQVIDVVQVQMQFVSLIPGQRPHTETIGDYIGNLGDDSFDIDRTEFKTVD